jgi:hypothetical protein
MRRGASGRSGKEEAGEWSKEAPGRRGPCASSTGREGGGRAVEINAHLLFQHPAPGYEPCQGLQQFDAQHTEQVHTAAQSSSVSNLLMLLSACL